MLENIAKDRKVIPDPIDDRKFQEWKESGKSGILPPVKENNEKKIKNCNEISKLIKAFPKDIAALDKRSVLAKVNSQGSGR